MGNVPSSVDNKILIGSDPECVTYGIILSQSKFIGCIIYFIPLSDRLKKSITCTRMGMSISEIRKCKGWRIGSKKIQRENDYLEEMGS